jgi:hypothetical protein
MKPNLLVNLDAKPAGEDRRVIARRPHLDAGRLILTKAASLECTVQDFHGGGARLALKTAIDVPWEDLALELLARGIVFPATKVWQSADEIGLRFTGNAWASR